MSPIDSFSITDKLFRLNENIKLIEDVTRKPQKEIIEDRLRYRGVEHLLQISIEIIFDIGSHVLAEEFGENPKTYQDIISALGQRGVIGKKFAEEQMEMAKFRNKLVHDYDTIDDVKVIEYARAAPDIFRTFGKAFSDFLKKK